MEDDPKKDLAHEQLRCALKARSPDRVSGEPASAKLALTRIDHRSQNIRFQPTTLEIRNPNQLLALPKALIVLQGIEHLFRCVDYRAQPIPNSFGLLRAPFTLQTGGLVLDSSQGSAQMMNQAQCRSYVLISGKITAVGSALIVNTSLRINSLPSHYAISVSDLGLIHQDRVIEGLQNRDQCSLEILISSETQ